MCPAGQRVSNCVSQHTQWALSTWLQACCRTPPLFYGAINVQPEFDHLSLPACLPACIFPTHLLPGLVPEGNDAVDPDEAVALGAAVQVG